MAQRFVKKPGQIPRRRGFLLFFLPLPLVAAFLESLPAGNLARLTYHLLALVLFFGGAAVARMGFQQEAAFIRRKVASAPRVPLKTLGACMVSAGTFVCALFSAGYTLAYSIALALLTFAGFYLAYGLDPRRDKVVAAGSHGLTTEQVVKALEEAEGKILKIEQAARRIRNLEMSERLRRIGKQARKVLDVIEEDPRDLRRARKFLYVYLDGAQRVSEGYAHTHEKTQSAELEGNFRKVLGTIEDVFIEQHQRLIENDVLDLDVQIEVLSTQMKREGVV
jgi:5-bromo-4-chloroindolyl phosphate hydrolysis protein